MQHALDRGGRVTSRLCAHRQNCVLDWQGTACVRHARAFRKSEHTHLDCVLDAGRVHSVARITKAHAEELEAILQRLYAALASQVPHLHARVSCSMYSMRALSTPAWQAALQQQRMLITAAVLLARACMLHE